MLNYLTEKSANGATIAIVDEGMGLYRNFMWLKKQINNETFDAKALSLSQAKSAIKAFEFLNKSYHFYQSHSETSALETKGFIPQTLSAVAPISSGLSARFSKHYSVPKDTVFDAHEKDVITAYRSRKRFDDSPETLMDKIYTTQYADRHVTTLEALITAHQNVKVLGSNLLPVLQERFKDTSITSFKDAAEMMAEQSKHSSSHVSTKTSDNSSDITPKAGHSLLYRIASNMCGAKSFTARTKSENEALTIRGLQ